MINKNADFIFFFKPLLDGLCVMFIYLCHQHHGVFGLYSLQHEMLGTASINKCIVTLCDSEIEGV